jgi:hypothetical protein
MSVHSVTPEIGVDDEKALLQATADMFGELINDLGSPLKALSVRHHLISQSSTNQ